MDRSFVIFLNSASSAAALVFYLPGVCTHTDTKGKQRKARVRNILKSSEKTQYLMNTLYKTSKNLRIFCLALEMIGMYQNMLIDRYSIYID